MKQNTQNRTYVTITTHKYTNTVVPPYSRVICSKTYHSYVKPRIIPNAIYDVIFV
jgi:hypothetical protein